MPVLNVLRSRSGQVRPRARTFELRIVWLLDFNYYLICGAKQNIEPCQLITWRAEHVFLGNWNQAAFYKGRKHILIIVT